MLALYFAMVACLASRVFRQMTQIVIIRWLFHGNHWSCSQGRADDTSGLGENRCDVFAEVVRVRAGFVGFVLTILFAMCKASKQLVLDTRSGTDGFLAIPGFPTLTLYTLVEVSIAKCQD